MAQTSLDREAILQTVRQWPLTEQIAFVQEVLESLRREVANKGNADKFSDIGGQTINVQITCATSAGLDLIVTHDIAGFRQSPIPAIGPASIVKHLPPSP